MSTFTTGAGALVRQAPTGRRDAPHLEDLALGGVAGESRAIRSTLDYVRALAKQSSPNVLLVGDPGTGKALFARALHHAGPSAHLPFVSLDCASAPETFLEAELFGYEPGAFAGVQVQKRGLLELAAGGTVLLENIESLPVRLQPKLMHALAKRSARRVGGRDAFPVKATVIASTTRPLEVLVAEGVFREDLFFELNAPRIAVPRLAEREEDVVLLAQRFLDETTRAQGLRPMSLTVDAHEALLSHDWPGNVRELRTVIRRAAELGDGPYIGVEHLRIGGRPSEVRRPQANRSLKQVEREAILSALEATRGDLSQAANGLDITVDELAAKVREYRLEALINHAPAR